MHLAKRFMGVLGLSNRQDQEYDLERDFLENLFNDLMTNPVTRQRVDRILSVNKNDSRLCNVLTHDERALPGDEEFLRSGWWKSMLTRYALGMYYSKGKRVLDSCSGLGWGSYLVDSVAHCVIAVDIDRASLELSKLLWPTRETNYLTGSVLNLCLESNSVDVVLAMESIEHFRLADIHLYLDELNRVLKPGGRLIGSSVFPETRSEANAVCAKNPYHLHICTRSELMDMLGSRFERYTVYCNRLFFWAEKQAEGNGMSRAQVQEQ